MIWDFIHSNCPVELSKTKVTYFPSYPSKVTPTTISLLAMQETKLVIGWKLLSLGRPNPETSVLLGKLRHAFFENSSTFALWWLTFLETNLRLASDGDLLIPKTKLVKQSFWISAPMVWHSSSSSNNLLKNANWTILKKWKHFSSKVTRHQPQKYWSYKKKRKSSELLILKN